MKISPGDLFQVMVLLAAALLIMASHGPQEGSFSQPARYQTLQHQLPPVPAPDQYQPEPLFNKDVTKRHYISMGDWRQIGRLRPTI